MRCVGVVPARGGSKSVPRKNIYPIKGVPLIGYTLRESQRSELLDRLVVSTDDDEIASIAGGSGVRVIMRPPYLATDEARTEDALLHAVDHLAEHDGFEADIVVTLEPTSPFRSARSIDGCITLLESSSFDAVVTVVQTSALIGRLGEDGSFTYVFPNQPRRRQEREPIYRESSTVYATRVDTLRETRSVLGRRTGAFLISQREALDINEPSDLLIAESLLA